MQITEQLIRKFFNGQCTGPEKLVVRSYFAKFPEMLEEYLTENAWQNFEHTADMPQRVSEKMFGRIHRVTKAGRGSVYIKYVSVAAAVLIAMSIWIFVSPQRSAQTAPLIARHEVKAAPEAWKFHVNTTTRMIRVPLADGSTVELQPGAELKYTTAFAVSNRDIYLKGNALFRVAAHTESPFTVFAGGLSTVALGTVFRVTQKSEADVRVQLLEGRVVVRHIHEGDGGETYLRPGQQLHSMSGVVSVQNIKKKAPENEKIAARAMYHFDDQPVATILKTLEQGRKIKFVYADSLVSPMRFTGVFDENKETVDDFISTLCMLNMLIMQRNEDTITILPDKR